MSAIRFTMGEFKKCSIEGCERNFYSRGYCKMHKARWDRAQLHGLNTFDQFPDLLINKERVRCRVNECPNWVCVKGFCKLHYGRNKMGLPLSVPIGELLPRGDKHSRWNGGTSEYPNHYLLKKNRKITLGMANCICQFCGGIATQVHHKDLTKDNHSLENLIPVCPHCHAKFKEKEKKL